MSDKNKSEEPFDAGEYFNSIQPKKIKDDKLSHLSQKNKLSRILAYDRLNALIRSEVYQADYAEYVVDRGGVSDIYIGEGLVSYHLSLSKAGKKLCEKWDLVYPVDPLAEPIEDYLYCLSRPIEFVPDPSRWKSAQANTMVSSDDKIFTHINDKLALLIDLSFPREKLHSELNHFLDRWAKSHKKGLNASLIDKWEVYDKRKDGNKLIEITREIHGLKKRPDKDSKFDDMEDVFYQQVKRADKSACEIIAIVEQMRIM